GTGARVRLAPLAPEGVSVRDRIGYLGMKPGLYGELTVRENLLFCARLRAQPAAAVQRSIERLDLGECSDRSLQTLSFGYQRRAGLARALLGDPELLLFDEPWNGLDDRAAQQLASLLKEAQGRGGTGIVGRER